MVMKYFDTGMEVLDWLILGTLKIITSPLWVPVVAIGWVAYTKFGWKPVPRPQDEPW